MEGRPNQLYAQGMQWSEQYDEICKCFGRRKAEGGQNYEVQKHLQFHNLSMRVYLTDRYALWLDFRMIDENVLHGTGRGIGAESAGALKAYIYLIMDSQLNIQMECLFLKCIRKMKEPHTALFVAPTGVGKTHLALDLLESEYFNHFNFITIICPTLSHNVTCRSQKWLLTDPNVIQIESGNRLYDWIEKLCNLLAGFKTLSLIDNIIDDKTLDKQRQCLLELAISGSHKGHSLWLLMQSYTAIPKNIRRQAKMLYIWYPKNRADLNTIQEENDVIETSEELANVKKQLKQGKNTYLIMRMEHPRAYEIR